MSQESQQKSNSLRAGVITGIVLLLVGFIAGPVLMVGQAILGGLIINNWAKIQHRLPMFRRCNQVIAAVLLVVIVGLLDIAFIGVLGRLVQSGM